MAEARQEESSKNIRGRVVRPLQIQQERFRISSTRNYSKMPRKELESHAEFSDASSKMLEQAMTKMGLSARSDDRILKVDRTIADLEEEENICTLHVADGIQYLNLDRPV